MNTQQFERAAKSTRRKAIIVTIFFHGLLFGGLAFATNAGATVTDTVMEWFQNDEVQEQPVKSTAIKKKKKSRA